VVDEAPTNVFGRTIVTSSPRAEKSRHTVSAATFDSP
jgi:hypothetical protein